MASALKLDNAWGSDSGNAVPVWLRQCGTMWYFAYGKYFSTGVAGIVYAYDDQTGELRGLMWMILL
jgi:hypothetical protein